MRKRLTDILNQSVERAINSGALKTKNIPLLILEIPRDETKGDFATTVAMTLAPMEKAPPRSIAEVIVNNIEDKENLIDRIEIAGPGYINFFLKKDYWVNTLKNAVSMGDAYGNADIGGGKSVQVEFLSANPTGPLHIGHGRVAAFGDTLANLLMTAGYNVQKEYYINDVGNQMETLGRSTYIRYKQLFKPDTPFIEDGYKGDYIKDIAQEIAEDAKDRYMHLPEEDAVTFFVEYSKNNILGGIKKDLEDFGVLYDNWFSEKSLHDNGEVDGVLKTLKEKDYLYESDGAQWLRTTLFGDDKDRVVVKSNGHKTYVAPDIAYHHNKFKRGFQSVIDIFGADHHGYELRMRAGIKSLGYSESRLKVILVQFVTLLREGKPVSMSTRAAEFVTLREVLDEVGKDAARFMFLTRRSDSHLDFDLEVVKKESSENPVYYVEYAHARIVNIFKQAAARGIQAPPLEGVDLSILSLHEEIKMMKLIASYPELIEASALSLEPHRITFYLLDLATALHNYYFHHRVITDDMQLTNARLILMQGIMHVLRNALAILGIRAPESM
ncbi:MAG: arginine--tRNA ligase [Nitrospirae bacterium RIFCSPHIGHO2_02_FULL_42_12]|nr:MAG: arginine--tRNA ligase [Nitrospirae bacterium RIFCSPHIGHO2_02_FULL_42_12]